MPGFQDRNIKRRLYAARPYVRAKKRLADKEYRKRLKTPEARAKRQAKRRAARYDYLALRLRNRLWHALKGKLGAGSAVRDLGCSLDEFKEYITKQFKPGMSWDNWGQDTWHLDHVKPLASFDLTIREQFLAACHYTNYQPLNAVDNLSKGASLYWYGGN